MQVTRAKILPLVADEAAYQQAAQSVERRSVEVVAHLVSYFNQEGMAALKTWHGGGQRKVYTEQAR